MEALPPAIVAKHATLQRLRPLAAAALAALDRLYDLELTWSSNAIEGNTLTAAETQLVIEKGITIAGKPLRDHLEALDHFDALRWVRDLGARPDTPITEATLRDLHRLVVQRSQPEEAGCYADRGRYVLTDSGRHAFPAPALVPGLMHDFVAWLAAAPAVRSPPSTPIAASWTFIRSTMATAVRRGC